MKRPLPFLGVLWLGVGIALLPGLAAGQTIPSASEAEPSSLTNSTPGMAETPPFVPVSGESAPVENSPGSKSPRAASDPGYQLQPDDVVEAVVFREPDLTTDGMVRKDGRFDMKLIGAIDVAGLTLDQASEVIRAALARDYLVNPRVNLGILEYAKRKVDLLGEVHSPGVYAFPPRGPLSIGDAVALAGGFLPTADPLHVEVKRLDEGRLVSLTVDASPGAAGMFELKPDDSISVPVLPRRHFTVLGQVSRPGTYEMPDSRPVYLTDAIAVAGGFTRIANPSRVLLKRSAHGHETVLALDAKAMANSPDTQRVEIENEDTITVTESMF
jgi:polysaccharide export outer membrane protein